MFKSEKVGCYLNSFGGHGDDPENKELKLIFFVSPISHELATEISPKLADRLFRGNTARLADEPEWEPAREITKASFSSIQILMQNITFFEVPDAKKGTMIPSAAISNLRAARGDSRDFRLEFDVVVPMDGETMRLVERYYKSTCFLTMEPIQREIEAPPDDANTEHQTLLQDAADDSEPDGKSAGAGEDGHKRRTRKKKE